MKMGHKRCHRSKKCDSDSDSCSSDSDDDCCIIRTGCTGPRGPPGPTGPSGNTGSTGPIGALGSLIFTGPITTAPSNPPANSIDVDLSTGNFYLFNLAW